MIKGKKKTKTNKQTNKTSDKMSLKRQNEFKNQTQLLWSYGDYQSRSENNYD